MAMPSALLPVAVGPTTARRRGVSPTIRGRARRSRGPSGRESVQSAASAPALLRPAAGWRFVVVEGDDERGVLVRELERERYGRGRELARVERGLRAGARRG